MLPGNVPLEMVWIPGGTFMMGAYEGERDTDNRPVETVSWDDITPSFLPALNAATGKTFRLPTKAQWEYAARAGTRTRFYWGDDPAYTAIGDYAWYDANSDGQTADRETHDVGGRAKQGEAARSGRNELGALGVFSLWFRGLWSRNCALRPRPCAQFLKNCFR